MSCTLVPGSSELSMTGKQRGQTGPLGVLKPSLNNTSFQKGPSPQLITGNRTVYQNHVANAAPLTSRHASVKTAGISFASSKIVSKVLGSDLSMKSGPAYKQNPDLIKQPSTSADDYHKKVTTITQAQDQNTCYG